MMARRRPVVTLGSTRPTGARAALLAAFGVALVLPPVLACNGQRADAGGATDAPAASASAITASSASGSASSAASSSAASASSPAHWTGQYTAAAGSLFYPRSAPNAKDWSDLTWSGSDAASGLGAGTLSLTVDPATKMVTGTADGAIGDALVNGVLDSGKLTAKVTRKNPDDRGLTGTIVGAQSGDAITGDMKLSSPDAQVIRDAKITLAKSP